MNWILWVSIAFSQTVDIASPQLQVVPFNAARPVIIGEGSNGNDPDGPLLKFNGGGDGLCYTGIGKPFRATGGKAHRVRVVRGGTVDEGTGFLIKTLNDGERPGEVWVSDVKILGYRDLTGSTTETARWVEGFVADGSSQTVNGAAGLRVLNIDGLRVASCTGRGDFIRFDNCVHLTGTRIQIDPGRIDAGQRAILRIRNGQNIFLDKLIINGDVIVEGSPKFVMVAGYMDTVRIGGQVDGIVVDGHVRTLIVEAGARGRCRGMVTTVQNASTTFLVD